MRLPSLAAALALLAATSVAGAVPSIPGGRSGILPPDGPAPRERAEVRFVPIDAPAPTLAVDIDLAYTPGAALPEHDVVYVGDEAPTAVEVRADDGRLLSAQVAHGRSIVIPLAQPGLPAPRGVHVHFEQPAPPVQRYGWRDAYTEAGLVASALHARRDVTVTVVVPEGARLPGFDCRRVEARVECTRTAPHHLERVPLVLRPRADLLGVAVLAITTVASVVAFSRLRRKRAREIVELAGAIPVEPNERPGGAYRAPPTKAVSVTADATEALRTLELRAAGIATAAIASTIVVAIAAAGRLPWSMPSVTAAWVAVVGFVAALLVERC